MVLPSLLLSLFGVSRGLVYAHGHTLGLTRRNEYSSVVQNPFASITPSNTLEWSSCYENASTSEGGPISCARLLAPLDYDDTSLGNVQLAIIKLGGTGLSQAHDAIFFNPGGPGDDPVENILNQAALLRAQVGNDSDIIAVIPRGVGSTFPPITCDATELASIRTLWEIQGTLPGYTRRSSVESYTIGQNLGLDCGLVTPDLIPYVGTVYVAHDMDFVRQALGQGKLSYLGYSYGSVLGGTYAALFPEKVGRIVLDGVLDFNDYYSSDKDPALDIGDADLALNNFFQACHDAGADACALWSNTTAGIEKLFLEADQRLFDRPLPVPGLGLLKWPLWRSGVYNALYRPSHGFPLLAAAVSEILNGTAGPYIQGYMALMQTAASAAEPSLIDPQTGLRNSPNAGSLISCSDAGAVSTPPTSDALTATLTQHQNISAFFASISSHFTLICSGAHLSAKKRYTRPFRHITTANPILFVGNTADPTTPIRNAHRMAEAFVGSRVLTVRGTGHISYNAAGDGGCATEWIVPYFRDGIMPPMGTVCDGKQVPFGVGGE